MKRKLLLLSLVLALLLSFSVTAFASAAFPKPPANIGDYLIVIKADGSYCLLTYEAIIKTDDGSADITDGLLYNVIDGAWVANSKTLNYYFDKGNNIVFDSTGVFATSDLKDFGFTFPVEFNDINPFYDGLKGQVNVKTVVAVVAVGASIVVGIVFMWWGVRKLSKALLTAFRKGKIGI